MPKAGISSTTSSDVTANGTASVTQSVTAKAMIARQAWPSRVRGIRLPARSSGGGDGSAYVTNISATADSSAKSLRSFTWLRHLSSGRQRVEILQRSAGAEQHDGVARLDGAALHEDRQRRKRGAAFRRGADAFARADREHAVDHRLVGDGE